MSRYRDQVAAALRAATIHGPTRYVWLGRASRPLSPVLLADLGEEGQRTYLVACLREELYCSFYCPGRPVPARWGDPEPPFADRRLVAELSRANTGRGSWEPGWIVERLDHDGLAVVGSGRLRARVRVSDCRAPSGALSSGAAVDVPVPSALPEVSPGFYTVLGDAPGQTRSQDGVRVYWNIGRAGAAGLIGALTARLNRDGLPFRMKVANHPYRFRRCDAAVLYLHRDVFASCRAALHETAADLKTHLGAQIPALTLELAPGVGLAEDAGERESFGVRRCALLAEAIVRAHEVTEPDARLDAVAETFAEEGVRLDAPYLEPALAGRHVL